MYFVLSAPCYLYCQLHEGSIVRFLYFLLSASIRFYCQLPKVFIVSSLYFFNCQLLATSFVCYLNFLLSAFCTFSLPILFSQKLLEFCQVWAIFAGLACKKIQIHWSVSLSLSENKDLCTFHCQLLVLSMVSSFSSLLSATWISHCQLPILSIDYCPATTRPATLRPRWSSTRARPTTRASSSRMTARSQCGAQQPGGLAPQV